MKQRIYGGIDYSADRTDVDYCPINGRDWSPTANVAYQKITTSGTIRNLYIERITAPGSGNTNQYTLYKNGAATSLTVTLSNSELTASDTSTEVTVSAGDDVCLRSTPTSYPASSPVYWNIEFEGDTANESLILGNSSGIDFSSSSEQYVGIANSTDQESNENDIFQVIPTSGKIKNFYVELDSSITTGDYEFVVRKDGVDTSLSVTISSGSTGSNTSTELSVSAGDKVSLKSVPTSSPSPRYAWWGFTFEADNDGESIVLGGSYNNPSNSSNEYNFINTADRTTWTGTESSRTVLGAESVMKKFHVELENAPGSGKSWDFFLRQDYSDTDLTINISGSDKTGSDTTNTVNVSQGEEISIKSDPTSNPVTGSIYWGFVTGVFESSTKTATEDGKFRLFSQNSSTDDGKFRLVYKNSDTVNSVFSLFAQPAQTFNGFFNLWAEKSEVYNGVFNLAKTQSSTVDGLFNLWAEKSSTTDSKFRLYKEQSDDKSGVFRLFDRKETTDDCVFRLYSSKTDSEQGKFSLYSVPNESYSGIFNLWKQNSETSNGKFFLSGSGEGNYPGHFRLFNQKTDTIDSNFRLYKENSLNVNGAFNLYKGGSSSVNGKFRLTQENQQMVDGKFFLRQAQTMTHNGKFNLELKSQDAYCGNFFLFKYNTQSTAWKDGAFATFKKPMRRFQAEVLIDNQTGDLTYTYPECYDWESFDGVLSSAKTDYQFEFEGEVRQASAMLWTLPTQTINKYDKIVASGKTFMVFSVDYHYLAGEIIHKECVLFEI